MKNFRIIVLVFLFLNPLLGYNQDIDSTNIARARKIITDNFGDKIKKSNFLLYGIEDKYLLILRYDKKKYIAYHLSPSEGIMDTIKFKKNSKELKKAFDANSYPERFVYSNSAGHNESFPKLLCLILYIKDEKKCEISMPVYLENVVIDNKKKVFPIDKEVHTFLFYTLLNKWYK